MSSITVRNLPEETHRALRMRAAMAGRSTEAEAYALLRARARAQGKAVAPADCYIVATAILHRLMVATRDTGPFEAAGLTVINHWNTKQ